jgi:hypothetical protein
MNIELHIYGLWLAISVLVFCFMLYAATRQ